MGSRMDNECRCRSSKLGRTSGRVTALGPRNIVFSTLAFTVQACDTMQSRAAMARMFGKQHKARERSSKKATACPHVAQSCFIGRRRASAERVSSCLLCFVTGSMLEGGARTVSATS